jgi:hypothetical protein
MATAAATKSSPLLDTRVEETCAGLQPSFVKQLHSISHDNVATIVDYIAAMKSEVNLSDHYRGDVIVVLCKLSKYNKDKPFRDLTRTDILGFLDSFRKTEISDPLHVDWHIQHLQNAFDPVLQMVLFAGYPAKQKT